MAANTYETGDARLSSVDKEAGSAVGTTLGNSFTVPAHPCAHGISASCTSPLLFATLTPARQRSAKGGSHCVARSRFSCQLFPIKLPLPAHAPYLHPVGKRTACGGAAKGKIMVNSPQHGEPIINQPAIKLSQKPRPGFKNLKPVCRVGVLPLQTVAASNENYDAPVGCASDNMFRIYDPYLGRFLSADPILSSPFDMQNYNRYSYVGNNPLKFVDPSGNMRTNPGSCAEFEEGCRGGPVGEFPDLPPCSGYFCNGFEIIDDVGPSANISDLPFDADGNYIPPAVADIPEDDLPEQAVSDEEALEILIDVLIEEFVPIVRDSFQRTRDQFPGTGVIIDGFIEPFFDGGVEASEGNLQGAAITIGSGLVLGKAKAAKNVLSNSKELKNKLPKIDGTGKLHGDLPHIKDLKNLDKDTLRGLRDDLRSSLKRRKQVTKRLGPDAAHSRREAGEENLLKSLDKLLGG